MNETAIFEQEILSASENGLLFAETPSTATSQEHIRIAEPKTETETSGQSEKTAASEWGGLTASQRLYLPFKRMLDVFLSLLGLIICAPLFLVVAIAIKLDSPGPVFYHHKRVGKGGKSFVLHKFRSMKEHSDNWKEQLSPEQLDEFQKNFKLENDPRITCLGSFLRKSSLDELPQLVNILMGDISLVGPRPIIGEELEKYGEQKNRLLCVKPGLTGYWQVNGRNDTTYEERIDMEMFYTNSFSPLMDIVILWKTIGVVIRKTGI